MILKKLLNLLIHKIQINIKLVVHTIYLVFKNVFSGNFKLMKMKTNLLQYVVFIIKNSVGRKRSNIIFTQISWWEMHYQAIKSDLLFSLFSFKKLTCINSKIYGILYAPKNESSLLGISEGWGRVHPKV